MFFNLFGNFRPNDLCWDLVPIKYDLNDARNYGGRVILPQVILEDLISQNIQPPYIFEIINKEIQISTFCGVLEFTSFEPIALVPQWIYHQISMSEAAEITLKFVKVKNGVFLKLLPHDIEFLEIESPKQELERCLINYQVLTKDDTIILCFEEKKPMRFTVIEVQPPEGPIYIVDTDLKVDFLPPIGYEEKLQREKSIIPFVEVHRNVNTIKTISMKKFGLFFDYNNLNKDE